MSTSPTEPPPGWRDSPQVLDVWKLPGFDKDTFYAAALYLHAAAKGQLREVRTQQRQQPATDEATRDFLDHIADCFARSKLVDPSAHVTATAMVKHRKEAPELDEWAKTLPTFSNTREKIQAWEASQDTKPYAITVIVAKNHSEKGVRNDVAPEHQRCKDNENSEFAHKLFSWFSEISHGRHHDRASAMEPIWRTLCSFNQSRLEYYVTKIAKTSTELVRRNLDEPSAIHDALDVISACRRFREIKEGEGTAQLAACARVAAKCRTNGAFQGLYQGVDAVLNPEDIDVDIRDLAKFAKLVTYLGRLGAACGIFYEYCTTDEVRDCPFRYELLQSPSEEAWPTATYKRKIEAWRGPLGLDEPREGDRKPVRDILENFAERAGNRGSARLHCEIQLLKYLTRPGAPRGSCDYIGCSKKSCWLCWQFIGHFGTFTTKDAHRMIYPMWGVPSQALLSDTRMADAVGKTYNDMLRLIQEKMLHGREFSSRQNITHTSPRLLFSSSGTMTKTTLQSAVSSSTSSVLAASSAMSLRPRHLAPFAKVPVIHLPAAEGKEGISLPAPPPSMLEMDLYPPNGDDDVESWMHGVWRDELRGVFACQLNSKLQVATKASVGMQEYRSSFWKFGGVLSDIDSGDSRFSYQLLYRTDDEDLGPNPWLLEKMRTYHGASVSPDIVPWRGDVFIFAHVPRPQNDFRPVNWRQIWTETKALRPVVCLPRIEEFIAKANLQHLAAKKGLDLEEMRREYVIFTSIDTRHLRRGIEDYWPDL